jgi:hypothetical protein
MLVKRLKAKAVRKSVARRAEPKISRKTAKVLKPEFTPEEVVQVEQQLARHQQSERAWQKLTAAPEGDDRWSEVEEHLVYKTQQHDHAQRRWKYFSK